MRLLRAAIAALGRAFTTGAGGGALLFLTLFVIELSSVSVAYMGQTDERTVNMLMTRYARRLIADQGRLLALQLTIGALLGALGASLVRLNAAAHGRPRSRRARFAGGLALATVAHVWMLARHLVTYPQLYDEWLYQKGGARKAVMVWATGHLTPRFLDAMIFAVAAAFAARLALSPRGGAAIGRAITAARSLGARLLHRLRATVGRVTAKRQNLAIAGAVVGAVSLAVAGALLFGGRAPAPARRPNVLLIAVDSLRADRVFGAEGASRFPTLAGLAARGVRFREAHVTVPRTFPSFVTLLTGRWPHHHGIRHMFPTAAARAAIGPSLVSSLAASGYATGVVADYAGEIFSRTPLGFSTIDVPHFDMTTILEQRGLTVHPHALPYATSAIGRRLFHSVDAMAERSDPALLAERAGSALERLGRESRKDGGKPFFLTVFFSAAHFPYAAPAPFYKKFASPGYDGPFRYQKPPLATVGEGDVAQVRALYDGAVAAVDDGLKRLLARLEASGLSDDTIVVLTADHGEHLYDVAELSMGHGDHLRGDAADHVPLVIVAPGRARARDVDAVVRDVDVAPTLAALAGVPAASSDGTDLGPLLRGERDDLALDAFGETELWLTEEPAGVTPRDRLPYPSVFETTVAQVDDDIVLRPEWEAMVVAGKQRAIRTRDWKLIYTPTRDGARLRLEDPRRPGAGDQAAARPDVVALLRPRLERWMRGDPLVEVHGGFVVPRASATAPPATAAANASDRPPSQPLPSAAGVVRLLDRVGEATIETTTPLAEAWAAIAYPQKTISPWCGLRGAEAARCVTVTLAEGDVARWPRRADDTRAAAPAPAFDPVWNRTRGVYEAKTALFLPAPAAARFTLDGAPAAALTTSVATLPGSPAVELVIEIDNKSLARLTLTAREAGRWRPLRVALPDGAAPRTVRLSARPLAPGRTPVAALFATPTLLPPPAPTTTKPAVNVITVVIDTLRADALPVMPRLQAYAARAAHFTHAITAATWTRPSVLSLLGGDYPTALGHGAEEMIPSDADRRRFYALAPQLLPRALAERGHEVRAIGNNFFLLGHPQIGLDLGFDEVSDVRHPTLDTPAITRAALAFLEEHAQPGARPFFLHLHYDGPHWPYSAGPDAQKKITPPPGFPNDRLARAYLAEAAASDAALGELLDALDRLHLAERTVVVILGDHGEVFDAAHAHTVVAMNQPTLHHHGWSAYDEILRVPLVVGMPGTVPARRVDAQVRTIDIAPTIAALVGLPWPGDRRGRSLLSVSADRPAFAEGQNVRALRADGVLYLRRSDGRLIVDGKPRRADEELYALPADPTQHRDLATSSPAQLAEARARFAREAPILPEAPAALLHLRLAPDERGHLLEGTVRARPGAQLAVRGLQHGEAAPLDGRTVRFRLHGPGQLDLAVDPEDAALELAIRRDGTPVAASQLLVGPFALPLLRDSAEPLILDGATLPWLSAPRPPVDGKRGDILVYRDPPTAAATAAATTDTHGRGDSEVASMMRRWGYAK